MSPSTNRRLEGTFWLAGLALVAALDPVAEPLVRLCPFHWIGTLVGTAFCPGCGLGHAVGLLARGEWAASFAAHPLGIPAVLILGAHAAALLRRPAAAMS